MPRRRQKQGPEEEVILSQPRRGDPTDETLIQMAQEKGLFDRAQSRTAQIGKNSGSPTYPQADKEEEEGLSPGLERLADTAVWSLSLAMLHFTLDVLVQHQYAVRINWRNLTARFGQSLAVFLLLYYVLHPHRSSPVLLPGLPARFQHPLRQAVFFMASTLSGCYLIYITNMYSYLAVMKQAPSLGCLWVWSVVELDLLPAVISLAVAGLYLWAGGFSFM